MEQNLSKIVKYFLLPVSLLLLSLLLFLPALLNASKSTGNIPFDYEEFLPIIYKSGDVAPPTETPVTPYLVLVPSCGQGPTVEITAYGVNWDDDEAVLFTWNGQNDIFHLVPAGHGNHFSFTKTFTEANGIYQLRAESTGTGDEKDVATADFHIPCVPPTSTNTPTATATPINTPTPTYTVGPASTSTPTGTPLPCNVQFEGHAVADTNYVYVTGDIGTTVTIIDLTTGQTLGSNVSQARGGHACPGFTDFSSPSLNEHLETGHVLLAESSDNTTDTTTVLAQPPTATATHTHTPVPTNTATYTPTHLPTVTPSSPYIVLIPTCGQGPTVQVTGFGFNWDNDEALVLSWGGTTFHVIASGHGRSFSFTRSFTEPDGTYTMLAESTGLGAEKDIDTAVFRIPCTDPEIPTATPTPSTTPKPADLIIGKPQLISTPPIVAHAPLEFSVIITNMGEVDISQQFFVDLFLDPQNIHTDHIPLNESSGFIAVSSLNGGQSKQLTINAPIGFQNTPDPHFVYGMVDSMQQIDEDIETNNISTAFVIPDVTPAGVPTITPTPDGAEQISGIVNILTNKIEPQNRAIVTLIHPTLGVIATEQTDLNGAYTFNNIRPLPAPTLYSITACYYSETRSYFGVYTGVQAPHPYANIYMILGPCS